MPYFSLGCGGLVGPLTNFLLILWVAVQLPIRHVTLALVAESDAIPKIKEQRHSSNRTDAAFGLESTLGELLYT